MNSPTSFRESLQQSRQGNESAFRALMESCSGDIARLAKRRFSVGEPAESISDLVQNVWLRVWQRLNQFLDEGDSDDEARRRFVGWVGQILESVEQNRRRDAGRLKRRPGEGVQRFGVSPDDSQFPATADEVAADVQTPSVIVGAREEAKRVREAIRSLSDPLTREILTLRFLDDQSLRWISTKLTIPYHEVRVKFREGMRELTDVMGW